MRQRQSQFLGDEAAGERRIDIAHHDDPIGPRLQTDALIGDHDAAGLLGVAAAADPEIDVGIGQAEFGEESGRHGIIVMLAGMDDHRIGPGSLGAQGMEKRRHFHEVRTRRRDQMNGLF